MCIRDRGQYHDRESGLHYNRHRYYNPETGRYLTLDPSKLKGGLNGYRYTLNPTGWVDPLGLDDCPGSGGCKPAVGEQAPAAKVGVDEGEPALPGAVANPKDFGSKEKLDGHFEKHGGEFGAKNAEDYLSIARKIIDNGIKVQYPYKNETRTGFVMFLANNNKGKSKFAFVGTNNRQEITTAHVKTDKDFWKTINGDAKDKTIRPYE